MHKYIVIDAFAQKPLTGNPVAVFLDAGDLSTEDMQRIAQEMNLSEVTFVLPARTIGDAFIRIFTPVNELPFAGHPLLGTALAVSHVTGLQRLRLETTMGIIDCGIDSHDQPDEDLHAVPVMVRMRQPIPTFHPYEHAPELLEALGVRSARTPVEIYWNGPRHVFVGLNTVAELSELSPDHKKLAVFPNMAANCFALDGEGWRSRMFSPAYGVVEDAATGSAAGPLAIHLARHGLAAWGQEIRISQGVEMGRHAVMLAHAEGTEEHIDSVYVGGHATPVAHGTILV